MKKVILSFAIVLSSFFIFNFKVKADDINYSVDLSVLNDNFYTLKNLSEKFILDDTTYSDNYIIYLFNKKMYVSFIPLNASSNFKCYYSNGILCRFSSNLDRYVLSSSKDSILKSGTLAFNQNYVYVADSSFGFIPLYSSFDIVFSSSSSFRIIFTYNDFSTFNNLTTADTLKTIYQINEEYEEYKGILDNKHKEEKQVLESFYSLCIEKIKYLGEIFMSNYIYLTTLVVCILMFVFSLIVRRFL